MSEIEAKIARLTAKADELLRQGDAAGGAEGRRLLRQCRRFRLQVTELRKRITK